MTQLLVRGWQKFDHDAGVAAWAKSAVSIAKERVRDPEEQKWLRYQGTWFVGVDSLPNDAEGAVGASGALVGPAYDVARRIYGELPLHPGQVSVVYPGYPKPSETESDAAHGYRLRRDAAHVDGLLPVGAERRRFLKERHAYILGLPLTECDAGASPLSVWEGSHIIMRSAFERALEGVPHQDWDKIDLTEIYQAARREVFDTCERHLVPAKPGESYLVHRLALHGVAPWEEGADAPEEGRMVVYFRPEWPHEGDQWLTAP